MKITAQAREIMMLRVRQVCGMLALSLAGVLLLYGAPDAYAQKQKKKLTYEQAFALCKEDVKKVPGAEYHTAGMYARGAGCMKQHGYNLKKSAKF